MGYEVIGTMVPDNLIAGESVPILLKGVTIAKSGVLKRGSVLGVVTASGKAVLANKEAEDGSEAAKYILADDIDATDADVVAQCYVSGLFNRKALTFVEGNTAADHEDSLRQYGIFLKDNV